MSTDFGFYRASFTAGHTTTAGYIGGRRVAVPEGTGNVCYIANGPLVRRITIPSFPTYTQTSFAEGFLRAQPLEYQSEDVFTAEGEVCDLCFAPSSLGDALTLAVADTRGRVTLLSLSASGVSAERVTAVPVAPQAGLCTCSFLPGGSLLAVTCSPLHTVTVFDLSSRLSTQRLRFQNSPSFSLWAPKHNKPNADADKYILATLAGGCIVLHDLESGTRKIAEVSSQQLRFAVFAKRLGCILVAGDDRTIHAVDTDSASIVSRWPGATQLSTVGIVPSAMSDDPSCVYAIGSNSQIVCGRISKKREKDQKCHSMKADSRWLGVAANKTDCPGDTLWGLTAAASLYVFRNTEVLLKSTASEDEQDE